MKTTIKALFFLWIFTMPFVGKFMVEAVNGSVEFGMLIGFVWFTGTFVFWAFYL